MREGASDASHASWKASNTKPEYFLDSHSGVAMSSEALRQREEAVESMSDLNIATFFNVRQTKTSEEKKEKYDQLSTVEGVINAESDTLDFAMEELKNVRRYYEDYIHDSGGISMETLGFVGGGAEQSLIKKYKAADSQNEKGVIKKEITKLANERFSHLSAMIDYIIKSKREKENI
jgi:hypothetical protein